MPLALLVVLIHKMALTNAHNNYWTYNSFRNSSDIPESIQSDIW